MLAKFKDIEKITNQLLGRMKEKFSLTSPHTIVITLWDDTTLRVECRHGEPISNGICKLNVWTYYEGNITYELKEITC